MDYGSYKSFLDKKKSTSIKCVLIWGEQVGCIGKSKTLIH